MMIQDSLASIKENEVVSVYCDIDNAETHLTGFIGAQSNDQIIINHVSRDGYYDGYILVHLDDLFRVDIGGPYENKIGRLYAIRKQSHHERFVGDNLCIALLQCCKEHDLIISLEVGKHMLTGVVKDYDSEYIKLLQLNEFGSENGFSTIAIDEVISFAADTSTEQNIWLLYNANKSN